MTSFLGGISLRLRVSFVPLGVSKPSFKEKPFDVQWKQTEPRFTSDAEILTAIGFDL